MSQDQPAGLRSDEPAVIEWNHPPTERTGRWSSLSLAGWLVPALALLGAVAVFASLVGEWQITRVRLSGIDDGPDREVRVGVAWLGGWSTAYLTGVFILAACAVLVLFGPGRAREHLRLAGVAVSGVLLAVLVAAASDLGKVSAVFDGAVFVAPEQEQYHVSLGRGLTMAYVGTAALGIALVLAGRRNPLAGHAARPVPDEVAGSTAGDWPWRRPRRTAEPVSGPDHGPLDLTVGPAGPFAPPDRD